MNKKERRGKLEIYFSILKSIREENYDGDAKPTRVQFMSNLSYDNLIRYLNDLEGKGMVSKEPLKITEKGKTFLNEYAKVKESIQQLGLVYL